MGPPAEPGDQMMLVKPAPAGTTPKHPLHKGAVEPDAPIPYPFYKACKAVVQGKTTKVMIGWGSGEDKVFAIPPPGKKRAKTGAPKISRNRDGTKVKFN